jgi:hypothetical protein
MLELMLNAQRQEVVLLCRTRHAEPLLIQVPSHSAALHPLQNLYLEIK